MCWLCGYWRYPLSSESLFLYDVSDGLQLRSGECGRRPGGKGSGEVKRRTTIGQSVQPAHNNTQHNTDRDRDRRTPDSPAENQLEARGEGRGGGELESAKCPTIWRSSAPVQCSTHLSTATPTQGRHGHVGDGGGDRREEGRQWCGLG